MRLIVVWVGLLIASGPALAQPADTAAVRHLTILYTNDLHAHLEPQLLPAISPTRWVGGFANLATLVKQAKQGNERTLYFDAGDFFTGPYLSTLTEGAAVIDVLNHLGLDATCIGNHEFDHGWQNVPRQFAKATFPILNGNIFLKGTDQLLWPHPYTILVRNGVRIGVIGLHGRFAFYDTTAEQTVTGIEARDEEQYLRRYIAELKDKTDLLVLLVHEGIPGRQSTTGSADVRRNLQKDVELAQRIPGLDLIVTGHAHQGTPQPLVSNGTLIVSTDALGSELGRLELDYDRRADRITSYTNHLDYVFDDAVPDDAATLAAIRRWQQTGEQLAGKQVATLTQPLTRAYGAESTLGDVVADAMLAAAPAYDFAVVNSGGLRQDIAAGPITVGNLISAFPFLNTLVKVELRGTAVRELFEHSAALTNGVLQVSRGVSYRYDERRPLGQRVTQLLVKGVPLDDQKTYKVLTTSFLADGGDGYLGFRQALRKQDTGEVLVQPIRRYLHQRSPYTPRLDGRLVKQ